MPVRSSRKLYKIDAITVKRTNVTPAVTEPIVVKMKASHAGLLGLTPLASDDAIFTGSVAASGDRPAYTYLRNLGGFRERAYTLEAVDKFTVNETDLDGEGTVEAEFKTLTIGFPRGASVLEVYNWIRALPVANQVAALISHNGRRIPIAAAATP
jgi:hypothetical protein